MDVCSVGGIVLLCDSLKIIELFSFTSEFCLFFCYFSCCYHLPHLCCRACLEFTGTAGLIVILYSFQSLMIPFVFHFKLMSGCDPAFTEQMELIFHAWVLRVSWYGNVFQFNKSCKNVCNINLVNFQCASRLGSRTRIEYWTYNVCRYSTWNMQHVFTPDINI